MNNDRYPTRTAGEPHLLFRNEPVVWSEWTPDAPLSQEDCESYRRDGFIVLDGLFGADEIAVLQAEARRLSRDPAGVDAETVIAEPNSEEVRSIFRIHEQNALMQRLSADARLAGIASFLLDDEVAIHQSRVNFKPGLRGKEFYWHSDFETWHAEDGMPEMRALSASVLLTDNTELNGPLLLMPGSQNTFVSCIGETPDDNYRQSLKKQDIGVPDDTSLATLAAERGITAATGKAGTVILFDCNTMHGSNGNITPSPRSNAFFVFNAKSNALTEPFAAPKRRPDFIAAPNPRTVEIQSGPIAVDRAA